MEPSPPSSGTSSSPVMEGIPADLPKASPAAEEEQDPADRLAPEQAIPMDLTETENNEKTSEPLDTPDEQTAVEEEPPNPATSKALDDSEKRESPDQKESRNPEVAHRASLKVHWHRQSSARKNATRLVRAHTGRLPEASAEESDDDDALSISSSSTLPLPEPGSRKDSRNSSRNSSFSSMASDWSSDGSDHGGPGPSGVLSALLGLYRGSDATKPDKKEVLKGLLSSPVQKHRQRRRWSENALFAADSRDRRRNSGDSQAEPPSRRSSQLAGPSTPTAGPIPSSSTSKVSRTRRHQELPHRSQNLDEPYIPAPFLSSPLRPSINVSMGQRFRQVLASPLALGDWVSPADSSTDGRYRSIAALIIATSGFMAIASPELAHLAPASGSSAETSGGRRKISRYEGVAELDARDEDAERAEEVELSRAEGREEDVEKLMEEGRLRMSKREAKAERKKGRKRRGSRQQREMAITRNVTGILQRKKFIESLAKSVVNYGAPSHSVESWLSATAEILQVDASFIYFPSVLIVAFRDTDVHSTDVLFIRPKGTMELYRLSLVHDVYRRVIHDEISASRGTQVLRRIEKRTKPYSRITLVCAAAVASATASRVAFSGSFIDLLMSGFLGSTLAFVKFNVQEKHQIVSNIFEIGMAGILSFIARALGSTKYFCYESVASASIVLILPGWHICLGALELGSNNIVAGAIRVVWAIVYTLFLSFGLSIGSQIYDAFGPSQLTSDPAASITITGSFSSNNTAWDTSFNNGTFTFQNVTSSDTTTVACYRDPAKLDWWYTEIGSWWLFLLVPIFAYSLAIWFRADYRSRDIVVMILVASAGYAVDFFVSQHLDQANVASAVAAFAIGILGNLYSRLGGGSAFPSMVVGILLEVPNGIAAAGGLSASSSSSTSSTSDSQLDTAVVVSIRMIQVGIGLAIGLFAAALVVYPFGKKGRYIFSF